MFVFALISMNRSRQNLSLNLNLNLYERRLRLKQNNSHAEDVATIQTAYINLWMFSQGEKMTESYSQCVCEVSRIFSELNKDDQTHSHPWESIRQL